MPGYGDRVAYTAEAKAAHDADLGRRRTLFVPPAGSDLYGAGGLLEHAANASLTAAAATAASSPLLTSAWDQLVAKPVALLLGQLLAEDSSFRASVVERLAPAEAPAKWPPATYREQALQWRSSPEETDGRQPAPPRVTSSRRPGRSLKGGGGGGGGESTHPEAE